MARPRLHRTLLTLSLGFPFVAFTIGAHSQTQALPHDTAIGRLEILATFSGPMPTGVTVSRTNRVFVSFSRWGDDVPFTVAEIIHGKAVAYPDAVVIDWPGRNQVTPHNTKGRHRMKTT